MERKARALFQELMEEAFRQYGFIVENMPVMVEAVPLQDDSLVLIITRVENPEELDTRFSNFAPSVKSGGEDEGAKDSSSVLSQLLETIRRELGEFPEKTVEKGIPASGVDPQPGPHALPGTGQQKSPRPGKQKSSGSTPSGSSAVHLSLARKSGGCRLHGPGFLRKKLPLPRPC